MKIKYELKKSDPEKIQLASVSRKHDHAGGFLAPLGFLLLIAGACMLISGSYCSAALAMEAQKYAGGSCVDISEGDDACDKASSYVEDWIDKPCLANESPAVRRQCGGEKSQGFAFSTTEWDVTGPAPVPCPGKEMKCIHMRLESGDWGYRWVDTSEEGVCGYRDTFELSNARPNSANCPTPTPTPDGGEK